jgi:hypothetical protein
MDKGINSFVLDYQQQIRKGDIQETYAFLLKYVMQIRASIEKQFSKEYSFGNVFHGYLDYSYFYFSNDYLRSKQLRFGIVLNHSEMRFELWLFGQNKKIQDIYWNVLKSSPWNQGRTTKPQYSVLETTLIDNPDFENIDELTDNILKRVVVEVDSIIAYLREQER